MKFEWQAQAQKYHDDLSMYVWRPYAQIPRSEYIEVFISGSSGKPRNLLILLKSKSTCQFLDTYMGDVNCTSSKPDTLTAIIMSIYSIYLQILEDTSLFVKTTSREIATLVSFSSYQWPFIGLVINSYSRNQLLD